MLFLFFEPLRDIVSPGALLPIQLFYICFHDLMTMVACCCISFTVPCDMSQRLDKEPWIAAFLSRISEKLKRYKQIWASMQLEMEVTSDQLVVL